MTLGLRASSTTSSTRRSTAIYRVLVACCLLMTGSPTAADTTATSTTTLEKTERVQVLVDAFRARLNLPSAVTASIVPENPLLVSVSPPSQVDGAYGLAFEGRFLDRLSDDELKAVVAHELGHVWIFTHHPYLQTEAGANQIAERLVTRQTLERVYAKVWPEGAPSGVVARFADAR
jgi:predicted metallopeptidase